MKKTITFFKKSVGSISSLHASNSKQGLSALRLFVFVVTFLGFTANSAWGQTTVNYAMSSMGLANTTPVGTSVRNTTDEKITFTFAQNNSTTAPAYYTSGTAVRLYQNATKGGSIKIMVASGYKIISATVTKASGDGDGPVGYVVDGGTEAGSFLDGTTSNTTGAINATSSVEFYSKGSDSKTRFYVVSFSVTYEATTAPAATPTFSPAAGTYTSAQSVSLSSTTSGAKIYYTTNGTDPSSASSLYSSPINVGTTTTIKAIAYDSNDANPSSIATAAYTINATSPTITVTGTLNAFANTVVAATTAEQSYTLQGANLTGDVTVTPPAGFEISKSSGSGFVSNPSTLTFTSGEIASAQNVYVRFAPTAAQAYSGNITHTSIGAAQVDKAVSGTGVNAEPTNQPTGLTATANSSSQITVTWIDASGVQVPAGYIVKAAIDPSSPTAPVDGTAEADATFVKNIAQGTPQAVFTGLNASTTYNFSIWPYTNSAAAINYKTDGTVATASATTVSATNASDYFRSKSSGNWSDINTWESSSDGISWIPATLTPTATANNITVLGGNIVTVNASISVDQLNINTGGKIIVSSSITLTIANGSDAFDLLVEGIVENSGTITASTDAAIKFNSGGYYKHTRNGGSCIIATWDNNSTCEIAGVTGTVVSNLSQSFGNFIWNCTSQSSWINLALTSSFAVAGNLTINSTSTFGLNAVTSTASREFNIGGNLLLNGAKLTLANNSGIATLNIGGNLMLSANSLNQLDFGYGSYNPTGNYRSIINLSGNLNVGLGATITCTDNNINDDNGKIIFNKPGAQNISNNGTLSWIDFEVLNGSTLELNTDLDAKSLQIDAGGILNIPAAKQLTISGTATNNGTITIQSDATGTGTIVGNVSGTATVNQHLSSYRTWYLSSPVSNVTPANMNRYKFYDEATNTWTTTAPAQTIGAGFLAVPTDNAVTSTSFTGTLNNGNININVTRSVGNGSKPGFNLVGNPYPSYLDWTSVYANNNPLGSEIMPTSTMWYRTKVALETDPVTYEYKFWTVNGASGVGSPSTATKYIAPMQSFWVRAKNVGTSTLTFTNAMRKDAPAENKLLKAPAALNTGLQLLRLQVSNESANTDEAVIYFNTNASNGLDAYDSPKMSNENAAIPEIYTSVGNEQLVINGLNAIPLDQEIGLGFVAGNATSFSIKAKDVTNLPSDVKVILKDNVTKAETDLTDGTAVYSFSNIATSGDRFSIIFRTSGAITGIDQPTFSGLTAYSNANNQLTVLYDGAIDAQTVVSVYNAVGQRLVTQSLKGVSTVIDGEFAPGVYVVKVNNLSRKLTIKK